MKSFTLAFLSFLALCCSTSRQSNRAPSTPLTDTAVAPVGAIQMPGVNVDATSSDNGSARPAVSALYGATARWALTDEGGKHPIVSINQDHYGFFTIEVDPDYRIQFAEMSGAGERAGSRVIKEFHEVGLVRLGNGAATRKGWVNPFRIDRYNVPVTQFTGRRRPNSQTAVDVWSDANGHYLIVTTLISIDEQRSNPPVNPNER